MRKNVFIFSLCVLIFVGFFGYGSQASAESLCGTIAAPSDWFDTDSSLATTDITDCGNPFGKTDGIDSPYTLLLNTTTVHDGASVELSNNTVSEFHVLGSPRLTAVSHLLFRKEGNDYQYVSMKPREITEEDYARLAHEFFGSTEDVSLYVSAALDRSVTYTMDEATQDKFWNFLDYVDTHFVPAYPDLTPGTYILVSKEVMYILTKSTLFERALATVIPTAYADEMNYTFTLTFTIEAPQKRISNILFLPGIQASRLYTKVGGEEERLWEPFGDDDVEMLRMTDGGASVNDVYTKDVVDELPTGSNIYKGFVAYLNNLSDEQGDHPMVRTFPYDWRRDVFDIVEQGTRDENGLMKKPTAAVEYLAALSPTKKTTIIAHSNGGLLAKAIMLELEKEGKANLVDKVIFIASPHIGTPKGLMALLHGYDQENLGGLVSSDEKVRSVMQNMPGVYGLLPNASYITSLSEPILSFDTSSTTALYRTAYGFTISNLDEYKNFLMGVEGRESAGDAVNKIGTTNRAMLEEAFRHHQDKLDNWTAPLGVEVFNIVGTGLSTPNSIEYKEFKDAVCAGTICIPRIKVEPVLHFTWYGDGTVVSKSAKKTETAIPIFVNLKQFNEDGILVGDFEHSNIAETIPVQTLINHILHGSSTGDIEFVSNTEPTFSDVNTDIYTIHSPAHFYLKDAAGHITGKTETKGMWQTGIPGSSYHEAGGVKYVLVPSTGAYTVVIKGEDNGVYTHTLSTLKSGVESVRHAFTASITPTSTIEYTKANDDTFSIISIDENGDGVVDKEMTLSGLVTEKQYTYTDLQYAIRNLKLERKYERTLLSLAAQAEKMQGKEYRNYKKGFIEEFILNIIKQQLEWCTKKKLISRSQYTEVSAIIDKLIKN